MNASTATQSLPISVPRLSAALAGVDPAERFNVASHAAGAVASGFVTIALVPSAFVSSGGVRAIGLTAYCLGLTAGYVASVLYHGTRGATRRKFRRLDRATIYVALAGLYTSITLTAMPRSVGLPVLALAWGVAALGASFEMKPASGGTRRSVLLYLVMGWGILFAWPYLLKTITPQGLAWLIGGGVLYSAGAMLLRCQRVPRNHEIWHLLALAGNACHLVMMLCYLG